MTKPKKLKPLAVVSPIHKAGRQMSLYLSKSLFDMDVAPGHGHLLTYVSIYGPCPVGELVRVFGYKKTSMTNVLNLLSDKGYIVRLLNPSDSRSLLIRTTPKGTRLAKSARKVVENFDSRVTGKVTQADLRGFQKVMEALSQVTGVTIRETQNKKKTE